MAHALYCQIVSLVKYAAGSIRTRISSNPVIRYISLLHEVGPSTSVIESRTGQWEILLSRPLLVWGRIGVVRVTNEMQEFESVDPVIGSCNAWKYLSSIFKEVLGPDKVISGWDGEPRMQNRRL